MRITIANNAAAPIFLIAAWTSSLVSIPSAFVQADEQPASKRNRAWIEQRVEDWQPTKAERAFDEIGWAKDLGQAERLAKEHGRPIFLFTYSGASMACYRC